MRFDVFSEETGIYTSSCYASNSIRLLLLSEHQNQQSVRRLARDAPDAGLLPYNQNCHRDCGSKRRPCRCELRGGRVASYLILYGEE